MRCLDIAIRHSSMWMESFNSWYTVNGYEWAFLTVSREMHDVTESSNTRHSLTILTNVWIETLPFCRRVVRKPWYSLMASSLEWNDFVPFPSEHAVSMTTANAVAIQMASLIQPCEFDFALCNICFMQWRLVCPPKSWVSYFIVVIILSLILKLTVQS